MKINNAAQSSGRRFKWGVGIKSVIGHFVPDTDGYVGSIRTLTLNAKLRLMVIDNKTKEDQPDFLILYGMQEVGAAWKAKTHEVEPRDYLSAFIDDPAFPELLCGAMFEDNGKLRLVWRRKT